MDTTPNQIPQTPAPDAQAAQQGYPLGAIPQEQAVVPTITPQPQQAVPATSPMITSTPVVAQQGAPQLVLVQLPMWKNPRMYIAAAAAVIIIVAGIFLSKGSGLKGSFDNYDPALDYSIQAFTISQPADGSFEMGYKIDKAASNLFMAITMPSLTSDLPENDDMVKLIALSDSDLTAGEHKVQIPPQDLTAAFAKSGTYRFQIIAYNANDEITDFKAEKRTVTVEKGVVKLIAPIK